MEYNAESPGCFEIHPDCRGDGSKYGWHDGGRRVQAAIDAVRTLSVSIDIPQKLHEINVKEEDIPALAVAAFNDVCTGGNPRSTSIEDIEAIYRKAF